MPFTFEFMTAMGPRWGVRGGGFGVGGHFDLSDEWWIDVIGEGRIGGGHAIRRGVRAGGTYYGGSGDLSVGNTRRLSEATRLVVHGGLGLSRDSVVCDEGSFFDPQRFTVASTSIATPIGIYTITQTELSSERDVQIVPSFTLIPIWWQRGNLSSAEPTETFVIPVHASVETGVDVGDPDRGWYGGAHVQLTPRVGRDGAYGALLLRVTWAPSSS